jgi:reelin
VCVCDTGYELFNGTCVSQIGTNPEYLAETFDGDVYPAEGRLLLSTGVTTTSAGDCGPISALNKQNFMTAGRRFLVTRDLNTTAARFIEFNYAMGQGSSTSPCNSPSSSTEGLVLGYSNNGGIDYTMISAITYGSSATYGGVEYLVNLPEAAQTPSTRFMLRQPSEYNGFRNTDVWVSQ